MNRPIAFAAARALPIVAARGRGPQPAPRPRVLAAQPSPALRLGVGLASMAAVFHGAAPSAATADGAAPAAKPLYDGMITGFKPEEAKGYRGTFQFEVDTDSTGAGGHFYIDIDDGKATFHEGDARDVKARIGMARSDFEKLARRELNGFIAYTTGKIRVSFWELGNVRDFGRMFG